MKNEDVNQCDEKTVDEKPVLVQDTVKTSSFEQTVNLGYWTVPPEHTFTIEFLKISVSYWTQFPDITDVCASLDVKPDWPGWTYRICEKQSGLNIEPFTKQQTSSNGGYTINLTHTVNRILYIKNPRKGPIAPHDVFSVKFNQENFGTAAYYQVEITGHIKKNKNIGVDGRF